MKIIDANLNTEYVSVKKVSTAYDDVHKWKCQYPEVCICVVVKEKKGKSELIIVNRHYNKNLNMFSQIEK